MHVPTHKIACIHTHTHIYTHTHTHLHVVNAHTHIHQIALIFPIRVEECVLLFLGQLFFLESRFVWFVSIPSPPLCLSPHPSLLLSSPFFSRSVVPQPVKQQLVFVCSIATVPSMGSVCSVCSGLHQCPTSTLFLPHRGPPASLTAHALRAWIPLSF